MDDVNCAGSEADLLDCPHSKLENCGPADGAGVICNEVELRGGNSSSGNVWITDKNDSTGPVCGITMMPELFAGNQ